MALLAFSVADSSTVPTFACSDMTPQCAAFNLSLAAANNCLISASSDLVGSVIFSGANETF